MLKLLVHWKDELFLINASEELQEQMTSDQLRSINSVIKKLGDLISYRGARGRLTRIGWQILATYRIQADFQQGYFAATVTLTKQNGRWTISQFLYYYSFLPLEPQEGSLQTT